ncbi:MAG: hypothetical protein ACLUKN_14060 [Bacilli bacterium]
MTQTSHLNKLAFKVVKSLYADAKAPELIHVPGTVTSVVRKNWDLLPSWAMPVLRYMKRLKRRQSFALKDEIRSITHFTHAVDAVAMGLAGLCISAHEKFLRGCLKRRLNQADRQGLLK